MSRTLSIAIVSDLHAHTLPVDDPNPPSFLSLHRDSEPLHHPIAGLKSRIEEDGLKANVLLCAGDMGDKADHAGQAYVWEQLQQVGNKLGATLVIGTTGNHDMDSRHTTEVDAKGILQSLAPMFPGLSEQECDRFWSRNFVIHEEEDWRIVVLNSAAYHGGRLPEKAVKDSVGNEEYDHGRISDRTLAALRRELDAKEKKPLNILLCHHHPLKNDEVISDREFSEMVGGDLLLSLLAQSICGDWLVIHGHRHLPRLWYAGGNTGRNPVILSAGSLSARLYAEIAGKARNQFYIVDIDLDEIVTHKVGVVGEVRAWDWIPSLGWQTAANESNIPKLTGFGWRDNPDRIAQEIATLVTSILSGEQLTYISWTRVQSGLPMVKYMNRATFAQVRDALMTDHSLRILEDRGDPDQIGPAR